MDPKSTFRDVSRSSRSFRDYMHRPCGKANHVDLKCVDGPNMTEKVEIHRRQCCRFQLHSMAPACQATRELHEAKRTSDGSSRSKELISKKTSACNLQCSKVGFTVEEVEQCMDCEKCGFDRCLARCPVEWDENEPAAYKAYKPRLSADGKSYQNELQVRLAPQHVHANIFTSTHSPSSPICCAGGQHYSQRLHGTSASHVPRSRSTSVD